MGSVIDSVFGGSKKKSTPLPPPPVPEPVAPAPRPEELDSDVAQKDRDRRRQRIAQAGRSGTILTQGQSLSAGSATLLGRSV